MDPIKYSTDNLNLATTLMYYGAYLASVEAEIVEKPIGGGNTRTECMFHLIWIGATTDKLFTKEGEPKAYLPAAKEVLEELREKLIIEDLVSQAQDIQALYNTLEISQEETDLDFVIKCWRNREVRVEPRAFDDCKRQLVHKMRSARSTALTLMEE